MTIPDPHLPWPAEWARPRRGPWFVAVAFFVLFGLLSVLPGVRGPVCNWWAACSWWLSAC